MVVRTALVLVWAAALALFCFAVVEFLPLARELAPHFIAWVAEHEELGMLVLGLCVALSVVLLLPVVVLSVAAGFLFGLIPGSLIVATSSVTGAFIAFLLGRSAFHTRAAVWLATRRDLRDLSEALRSGGWRAIALLRLIPVFPYKMSNYALGALPIAASDFVLGTALGIIPMTVLSVAAGVVAQDVTSATDTRSAVHWSLQVAVLCGGMIATWVLGRRAFLILRSPAAERSFAKRDVDGLARHEE